MIVFPNEKLPGSTSVACWLVEFVNVSVLSLTSGVVAGGKFEEWLFEAGEEDPQPIVNASKMQSPHNQNVRADKLSSPYNCSINVHTSLSVVNVPEGTHALLTWFRARY